MAARATFTRMTEKTESFEAKPKTSPSLFLRSKEIRNDNFEAQLFILKVFPKYPKKIGT